MNKNESHVQPIAPLVTITILFFMWGFITCMNDILIPYLKVLFQLTFLKSMLVQFCFFGAYFIGSLIYFLVSTFYEDPVNKIGYKNGILFGICLAACGCLLFYPAASLSSYPVFLMALFILGLGFTALQITANAYVSLLGAEELASSRLNMAQAFNAFGTTIAPILGGYLIFELFSHADGSFSPLATRIPYIAFAAILLMVGLMIYKVRLPSFKTEEVIIEKGWGALKFSHLRYGVMTMFCYVGAEVAVGSFIISFLELPEIMEFDEATGKNYLALYWGGAMVGRFMGAISLNQTVGKAKKALYMLLVSLAIFAVIYMVVGLTFEQICFFLVLISVNFLAFFVGRSIPSLSLMVFAFINMLLLLSCIVSTGSWAMYSILGIGLFNSIMFSNIYTLSISGLGRYTSQGSSLVVMAILGGAVVPLMQGYIADHIGVQLSFMLPALCYLVILIFGYYTFRKLRHIKNTSISSSGH